MFKFPTLSEALDREHSISPLERPLVHVYLGIYAKRVLFLFISGQNRNMSPNFYQNPKYEISQKYFGGGPVVL
jgi:hypothetical protein